MKKFLLPATVLVLFITACNNSSDNGMTMNSASNNDSSNHRMEAAVREVYKAMETGDVSKVDSFIAPDIVDHQGPGGRPVNGLDSLKAMFADMHNHLDNLKFDVIATAVNGDYGFSLSSMSATTKDSSMHVPPGTKLNSTFVDVVKFKDGKATEHWGFRDPKEMEAMMQHMMPPGKK
jgi:ketosteroid isomerase-like protein